MGEELKNIELETACVRLERERMELQDALAKRAKAAKVAGVTQSVITHTLSAGGVATSAAISTAKLLSKASVGAIAGALIGFGWVAANQGVSDFQHLLFDFGYWAGSGGFLLILACAIGYPLWTRSIGRKSPEVPVVTMHVQDRPSVSERMSVLRKQTNYWLFTCSAAALGGLAHWALPLDVGELFGGVLLMLVVGLVFWGIGLLVDFFRIKANEGQS